MASSERQMGWKMDVRRGLAAAVVTLLVTTGLSFYVDHQDRSVRGREIQVRSALEVALRNQKELSSMLLIAVLEQNPLRLKNFEAVNAELELAMQSIAALNRNPQFSDEIVALTERHRGLLQVTRNAMTLMHNGHWREARQVMVDDGYVRNASMQEIDLRSTVEALNSTLAAQADLFDMFRTVGTLLRVGSIALLLWVGARYSRQLREEVAAQRRIQTDLSASRQALREMAAHEQAKREQERMHLAQEIHDELGQRLTVLRMDVVTLPGTFGIETERRSALKLQVDKLKRDIDAIIAILRDVAGKLRPMALDVGLSAAVESMLADFEQAMGIPCDLDNRLPAQWKSDQFRTTVAYRILQESMTNAARHANATHIKVSLAETAGQLQLRVQDNGQGFSVLGGATHGLNGMRERAMSLGGLVHIASQPGVGTTVEAAIPLKDVRPADSSPLPVWLQR